MPYLIIDQPSKLIFSLLISLVSHPSFAALRPVEQPLTAPLKSLLEKAVDEDVHFVRQEGRLGEWQNLNPELIPFLLANPLDLGALEGAQLQNPSVGPLKTDPEWGIQLRNFVEQKNLGLITTSDGYLRPQVRNRNATAASVPVQMDRSEIENRVRSSLQSNQIFRFALSTLADVSIDRIPSTIDQAFQLVLELDQDHIHERIPAKVVNLALPADHIFLNQLDMNKDYLFSAIDFGRLNCNAAAAAFAIFDARRSGAGTLGSMMAVQNNPVIHLLSEIQLDSPDHQKWATRVFGRRPDRVISQTVFYSSSILRASTNHFYFFAQRAQTQVVLVSDMAFGLSHVNPNTSIGSMVRTQLFEGLSNSGALGTIAGNLGTLLRGELRLFDPATECQRGIAMGLNRYFSLKLDEILDQFENE